MNFDDGAMLLEACIWIRSRDVLAGPKVEIEGI